MLIYFITITSFLIRVAYIFGFTDYKNYLGSDMGGYWANAMDRFDGNLFSPGQYMISASFFHFYLTYVFKVLAFFNLSNLRLEAVIFLNVFYSSISIFFFYLILINLIQSKKTCIIATIFFAFCYPLTYLNAFVLAENISIPLAIVSIYFVLDNKNNPALLFISGMLFAFSVAARPPLIFILFSFGKIILR